MFVWVHTWASQHLRAGGLPLAAEHNNLLSFILNKCAQISCRHVTVSETESVLEP